MRFKTDIYWNHRTIHIQILFNVQNLRCCKSDQNILFKNSFSLIDYTFGSGANGCDLCAANLMRFWSWFTGAPNQADFAEAFDHIKVPDPFPPGLNVTVCKLDIKD